MDKDDEFNDDSKSESGDRSRRRRRTKAELKEEEYSYTCGCGKKYPSYPALYTHIKTKHEGIKPEGTSHQYERRQITKHHRQGRPSRTKHNIDGLTEDQKNVDKAEDDLIMYLGELGQVIELGPLKKKKKNDNAIIADVGQEIKEPQIIIKAIMNENSLPYYDPIISIFEKDTEFMTLLRQKKDSDFIDECNFEFNKVWVGFLDWIANLVRPEVYEEIAALLMGLVVYMEAIKKQKRNVEHISETIIEYCEKWKQIINDSYFNKDKIKNFKLVHEGYTKIFNHYLQEIVSDEPNNLNFEPTEKILEGSFIANMLFKVYSVLYHRKIVNVKLTKEDFTNVCK
jgi:hypothetical protein